jgi:hypothetical protein
MNLLQRLFGSRKPALTKPVVSFSSGQKNPKYKNGDPVFVYEGLTKKIEKGRIVADARFLDYFNKPDFYYEVMTETRYNMANKECIRIGGVIRKPHSNDLFQFYREDESVWAEKDDRIKLVHGQLGI